MLRLIHPPFLLLAVVLITIACACSAYTPYSYNCSQEPCVNGDCHNKTGFCECHPFYSGDDCSIKSRACPDGVTHCYNGGVCIASPDGRSGIGQTEFHCDCYKKAGIDLYTGEECEIPTFTSCERHSRGDFSFCVNGGTCTAYVTQSEEHVACDCSTAHVDDSETEMLAWGEHCEVVLDSTGIPTNTSTISQNATDAETDSGSGNDISGKGILVCVGLLLLLVIMVVAMVEIGGITSSYWHTTNLPQINASGSRTPEVSDYSQSDDDETVVVFQHPEEEETWKQSRSPLETDNAEGQSPSEDTETTTNDTLKDTTGDNTQEEPETSSTSHTDMDTSGEASNTDTSAEDKDVIFQA